MNHHNDYVTDYLDVIFNIRQFQLTIKQATNALSSVKFDAIAVMGNSGALFGGALAIALNKPLILVRKNKERSHSMFEVEGLRCQHYIIVDDFVCSGKTVRHIVEKIRIQLSKDAKCVGIYQYKYRCDLITTEQRRLYPQLMDLLVDPIDTAEGVEQDQVTAQCAAAL